MTGHLIETAIVAAVAVVVSYTLSWVLTHRASDEYARHSIRRAVNFLVFLVALNSLLGGIYRIGDRIEIAGVHGDVIDITPLRTKILEIGGGGSSSTDLWVHGRQASGRTVTVSNKTTFDEPTFNYSAMFEFVWHEVTFPIGHDADWQRAETILRDAAIEVSSTDEAQAAIDEMRRRYSIPISDLEPRVFVRATDNYMELSARFAIPIRTARVATVELTRLVHKGLTDAGIAIASTSMDVALTSGGDRTSRESSRTE